MQEQKRTKKNERGLTLIEVIVSMVILGLIISVFVPLSILVAKNIRDNKAKISATQIATAAIEKEIAATNPQNYSSRPTGYFVTEETMNGITFTVATDIEWRNDPADDDASGHDPIPFDYKVIQVTVSAANAFSGAVTQFADFRTFITREGGEEPFAGIEVTVERGWDRSPVPGAIVTLTPVGGGSSYTLATGENGKALQPLEFNDDDNDSEAKDYQVAVASPNLMMLPHPDNNNVVTATEWFTQKITIDMEEPCSITLNFSGQHAGGQVKLDYPPTTELEDYAYTREISPGQTSVAYHGLWPLGSDGTNGWPGVYSAQLDLLVYSKNFSSGNGDYTRWQERSETVLTVTENMWMHNGSSWYASVSNYPLALYYRDGQNRLVSPLIDLSPYSPQSGFTVTGNLSWQQNLAKGLSNLPGLVSKSRDGAAPNGSSGSWQTILSTCEDGLSEQKVELETEDITSQFRLLFDAGPEMLYYQINWVKLECTYNKEIQCSEPGQIISLQATR